MTTILWDKEYKEKHISSSFNIKLSRSIEYLEQFLLENNMSLNGKTVLDCGCGSGRNAIPLAKMGNTVYGIDTSEEAIKSARVKSAELNNIHFLNQSMCQPMIFKDNMFDIVADITTFDILINNEDILTHKKEVNRVLKKDGFFLYYDMDFNDPYSVELKNQGRVGKNDTIISPEPCPIPFKIYSVSDITKLFIPEFELQTWTTFKFKDMMFGKMCDRSMLCAIFSPIKSIFPLKITPTL